MRQNESDDEVDGVKRKKKKERKKNVNAEQIGCDNENPPFIKKTGELKVHRGWKT